jgi:hypothetical protein
VWRVCRHVTPHPQIVALHCACHQVVGIKLFDEVVQFSLERHLTEVLVHRAAIIACADN